MGAAADGGRPIETIDGAPEPKDGQMQQFLGASVIRGLKLTMKRAIASLGQGFKLTMAKVRLNKNTDES